MLPWAHAAFGYLLYRTAVRFRTGGPPGEWPVLALAVGTQFPDLIDKPLSWTFALLPTGRSLSHSVFSLLVVVLGAVAVARWAGRESVGAAFAAGYVSHVLGDVLHPVVSGDFAAVTWLLWPVVPVDAEEFDKGFVEFFASLTLTPWLLFGLVLTAVGLVTWRTDGYPGLRAFVPGTADGPVPE